MVDIEPRSRVLCMKKVVAQQWALDDLYKAQMQILIRKIYG